MSSKEFLKALYSMGFILCPDDDEDTSWYLHCDYEYEDGLILRVTFDSLHKGNSKNYINITIGYKASSYNENGAIEYAMGYDDKEFDTLEECLEFLNS